MNPWVVRGGIAVTGSDTCGSMLSSKCSVVAHGVRGLCADGHKRRGLAVEAAARVQRISRS